jgi:hypothetical protein
MSTSINKIKKLFNNNLAFLFFKKIIFYNNCENMELYLL